jgi:hypothetical protein
MYANAGDTPTFELKSGTSFLVGGESSFSGGITSTGTLDATGAKFLSKVTTASLTSLTLADGEFAIGALSATSFAIYFRSGVSTGVIIADSYTLV